MSARAYIRARIYCTYDASDRPINQAPVLARQSFAIAVGSEGTLSTIPLGCDLSVCVDEPSAYIRAEYLFYVHTRFRMHTLRTSCILLYILTERSLT